MKHILIVHGPNLNLLSEREPEIYGDSTLAEIDKEIESFASSCEAETKHFQSNSEGALIDFIHENRTWADGIILNPGALTHYSYSIRDAISAVELPCVEVHLSNILEREEFRKHSVIKDVCITQITGLGKNGYLRAIEYLQGWQVQQQLKAYFQKNQSPDDVLKQCVFLLDQTFSKYNWVGIYLVDGDELVLHNYIGKPSPHERIPIGKGICGAAVAEKQSIIVPDVNADPRYLACSVETRSEIVVPIYASDKIVGEIDIDSDIEDIFHDGDTEILEGCAEILGKLFM